MLRLFLLGLITPLIAVFIEFFSIPLSSLVLPGLMLPAQAFLGIALVEELVKFGALVFATHKQRPFSQVHEGAVCGITVAMGFALVENILYVIESNEALRIAMIRCFTSLPLHALTGALMGLAWARRKITSQVSLAPALLATIALHGFYDWVLMDKRIPDGLIWIILCVGFLLLFHILCRFRHKS